MIINVIPLMVLEEYPLEDIVELLEEIEERIDELSDEMGEGIHPLDDPAHLERNNQLSELDFVKMYHCYIYHNLYLPFLVEVKVEVIEKVVDVDIQTAMLRGVGIEEA